MATDAYERLVARQYDALYSVLRERKPFVDATLAVFERRPASPSGVGGTDSASPPARDPKQPDLTPVLVSGFAKMKQLTRRVSREGARVVMGGHTEVPFAARGEAPWRELELLVESGFTPLEAISAATATAAAFLFRDSELGRLRAGFKADLVVLRGQPDRDVSAIRTVDRVMVAGRWIDIAKYRQY